MPIEQNRTNGYRGATATRFLASQAHIEIGEADPEQTHPRPEHVAAIETTDTAIGLVAGRRLGKLIAKSANQMSERMAAKGVAAKQNDVNSQHNRAETDAKGSSTGPNR